MPRQTFFSLALGLAALEILLLIWLWRGQRNIRSIMNHLLLAVVSIASCAVIGMLLIFFWRFQQTLVTQAGETLANLATSHSRRLGLALEREVALLHNLGETPAFAEVAQLSDEAWANLTPEERAAQLTFREQAWQSQVKSQQLREMILFNAASRALSDFIRDFPAYHQMWVVNPHGALIASSTVELPARYDYTQAPWWSRIWEDPKLESAYIEDIQPAPEPAALLVNIILPLKDANTNEAYGFLVAQFDLRHLDTFADFTFLDKTGDLHLVDEDGRVLYSTTASYLDSLLPTAIQTAVRKQMTDWQLTPDANGRERLYGYAPLQATNALLPTDLSGAIVVQQDASDILTTVQPLARFVVVGGVTVLLAIVAVSVLVSYRFTQPIWALTQTALAMQKGDLAREAELTGPRELQTLAQTFNQLTEQLRRTNASLETRVAARTHDLEVAATVAQQVTTILELEELLQQIVTLTASHLDYYACFIYLIDDDRDHNSDDGHKTLMRLAGADTEGGILQASSINRIPLETGSNIIAQVARTREAIVIDDVTRSHLYFQVPGFNATRAEAAFPLVVGSQLLGVFDVQATHVGHFGADELQALGILTKHVAIAVNNAQRFAAKSAKKDNLDPNASN